jgi:hypothetical protein
MCGESPGVLEAFVARNPKEVRPPAIAGWLWHRFLDGTIACSLMGGWSAGRRVPASSRAVLGKLELALQLVGEVMGRVRLDSTILVPLLRAAAQAMTVEGPEVLQVKAAGTTRSSRGPLGGVAPHQLGPTWALGKLRALVPSGTKAIWAWFGGFFIEDVSLPATCS